MSDRGNPIDCPECGCDDCTIEYSEVVYFVCNDCGLEFTHDDLEEDD